MRNHWLTDTFAGREKKRVPNGDVVTLTRPDGLGVEHAARTENVSDRGMRLVTECVWNPGDAVLLMAPKARYRTPARVIYCERLTDKRFAIGLELSTPLEDAAKS